MGTRPPTHPSIPHAGHRGSASTSCVSAVAAARTHARTARAQEEAGSLAGPIDARLDVEGRTSGWSAGPGARAASCCWVEREREADQARDGPGSISRAPALDLCFFDAVTTGCCPTIGSITREQTAREGAQAVLRDPVPADGLARMTAGPLCCCCCRIAGRHPWSIAPFLSSGFLR